MSHKVRGETDVKRREGRREGGSAHLVAFHAQRRFYSLALRKLQPVPGLGDLGKEGGGEGRREGGREDESLHLCQRKINKTRGFLCLAPGPPSLPPSLFTLFSTHSFSIMAATAKASV